MKQKLLLLAAVLCSAFSAHAEVWQGEELGENGVYYLYNVSAGVFLNSNGSVGTAPVDQWYFTYNAIDGTYTIKALKLNNVINPNATLTGNNSDYNFIWLDVSKSGISVNYVNAYTKDHPEDNVTDPYEGASTSLTLKAGTTGGHPSYQFYFERTWTGGRGNAFLAADGDGIKAVQGERNYVLFSGYEITCDDPSTNWYLVTENTYNGVEKETYYYNIETSASFNDVTTSVSFDDGVETWFNSPFHYEMEFPKDEEVNVSIPIYAKASPKEFYRVTGWKDAKTGKIVAEGNPGLVSVPFTKNETDKVSVIAEYTQIFTDAPEDGQYALYNPYFDVYMKNAGGNVSVTTDFNEAAIYTIKNDTEDPWIGQKFDYTTIKLDNTYVGQSVGSARNTDTQWIVEKRGEGYTLNAHNTYYYITASGSAISFPTRYNSSNEDAWAASTWMFITPDHLNSIVNNNTAVLAVNATVGYGTFVAAFDVTLPAGITAYTVSGFEGSTLILNKVADPEGTLAANTAVILQNNTENDIVKTVTGTDASGFDNANSGDYLVGTYERTPVPEGSYLLQYQDNHAAFFKVDGTNGKLYSGKNRAYLMTNVPQESSEGVKAFSLNGSETAIDEIIVVNEDTAIYDLSGRRLSKKPARGIYIQNGKKILVK